MTQRPGRITVAAYSAGPTVPSARLRVHQLVDELARRKVDVRLCDARVSSYPPSDGTIRRLRWAIGEISRRAFQICEQRRHPASVSLIQREMLSTLSTVERFVPRPLAFDCDDAIWLNGGGRAARQIARRADLVVCGNEFLADHFASVGRTAIVPTAVDLTYYKVATGRADKLIVGWCGQSSGHRYLDRVIAPLRSVLEAIPEAEFAVMSDRAPNLDLPAGRWRFAPWSLEAEPDFLASLTVGIMPLDDTDWERGKCSYKMLSYLASAVPVIVSPVGMNATILRQADVGWGPTSADEWVDAMRAVLTDHDGSPRRGAAGRALVDRQYSTTAVAARLGDLLMSLAQRGTAS